MPSPLRRPNLGPAVEKSGKPTEKALSGAGCGLFAAVLVVVGMVVGMCWWIVTAALPATGV